MDSGLNSPISLMRSNNKAAQVYWCYRQILKIADGNEVDTKLDFLKHFSITLETILLIAKNIKPFGKI